MPERQRIVLLDAVADATASKLRALLPPGYALVVASARGDDHLEQLMAQADFAIAGQVAVSARVLRAATRLRLLHKWGVGVDNIDLATARQLGIAVARTTGSNAVPVAETALGLMSAALRQIAWCHAEMQQGRWRGFPLPRDSFVLTGKTVGLVGFGAIGQRVARLLAGYDGTILYAQRHRLSPADEARLGARFVCLHDLLSAADVVSLHCPLTESTKGLIDRSALTAMKRSAVLVNTARGGIVSDIDLHWALSTGQIMAAAIDVYDVEPLPADSPLIGLPNLVTTPHVAALSADGFAPTVQRMMANIERVARGEPVAAGDEVI